MLGLILGTMIGTWASFLVSLVTKQVEVWPFVVVMLIFVTRISLRIKETKVFWITTVGWGIFLVKLFSQMMVVRPDGIWAGGSNVWGDWAGHVGYIANWLYGSNFPPQNPWYAGIRLSYPFLFDFTSAILAKMGLSIPWSMELPGIVFGLTIVILLFKLAEKISGKAAVGAIAVAIFMLSGGLGFVYLKDGAKEATHYYEKNIQWVNFVISEMVPQRGILIGIAAALLIFNLWWDGYEKNDSKKFLLSGVIAGLVPFFHAHTFLVLAAVSGFLFLIKPKKVWWYFFIPAGILVLPQLAYFVPQVAGYSPGFMRWQPGWTAYVQSDNWFWFWIKNIGPAAILIPVAWATAWKKDRKLFWLYMPFVIIFAAANLWIFQPWENDNSKLLRFWYLGSAILMGWWLARIPRVLAVIFLIMITLAGAIDAGSWLNFEKNKLMMWNNSDMSLAEWTKDNTPKDAIFLTTDAHNHWVVDLAGRKIVMGFKGWLWSWGINYGEREKDVEKMWNTGQIVESYNISYVIIGPGMKDNFLGKYPLLLDRFSQKIFDVRSER
ncbi:MAG: hypothetical protein UX99_C0002G0049 [Candidatus Amesbacteria bacterium GW2011_GWB1_47_26]|uniref:Glycosyltransferase RgtA/B/C/D-like domain-containing protein n=1 Tax=Candidatus Amesbacteria bacterium GW2011_GWC2_45_19 TaxID=1618366 RepID=A0A0G1M4I9_9BACT|nr:MAG: hypothetical protein UX05_C0004G0128 [Candidatus Amesbacteria bacterium GW2011_GWC2_45_19]KKU38787.1 MAG: hypothetical protein UX52_C0001G0069 [Candidatus Amesbacteria bacterium GW2011_GWA1_46_35]KKU69289.1 MAG: hypothetical protein UX93_C0002G0128 [Microgenomates group bacterium GW2011_GWC1_47_20]KKU75078.1 MAG: hypothetical protein UX99_C0002G0049 [Candidatus Amesbacteria bacterium GW2011_GWB1_47_26]KKU80375.1 MAG: hypothetical protein UY06_C0001G0003 [Candidatus Amesbacteria bacteriu